MKFKHIKLSFALFLALGLLVRGFQLLKLTDARTGLYILGREKIGLLCSALVIIFAASFIASAYFVKRCPLKTPRVTPLLGVCSIALATAISIETLSVVMLTHMAYWGKLFLIVCGIPAELFFIFYGVKGFYNYRLRRILYALPSLYFTVRLICEFVVLSKNALIFQNILTLAAIAFVVVFMFEWGKIANDVSPDNSYKRILLSGGGAAIFCFLATIPELCFLFFENATRHQNPLSLITLLFSGIFITVYLYHHFKSGNLKVKSRKSRPRTLRDTDGAGYYMGMK